MNITINGRITNALEKRRGTSKAGNEWVSQDFVIETQGEKICFNVFGEDRILQSGLKVGAIVSVTCKLESKEWNGKWFTSVSFVDGIVSGVEQPQINQPSQPAPQPMVSQPTNNGTTKADDLPF